MGMRALARPCDDGTASWELGAVGVRRVVTATTVAVSVFAALGCLFGALAFGVPAASATPRTSASASRLVVTRSQVQVRIALGSGIGRVRADVERRRGSQWRILRAVVISRSTTVEFSAPASPQQLTLRVQLVRAGHVRWQSRNMIVNVRAPTGSPTAPAGTTTSPTHTTPTGTITTPTTTTPNPDQGSSLTSGESLQPGQYLQSPNGSYELIMQADRRPGAAPGDGDVAQQPPVGWATRSGTAVATGGDVSGATT